MKACPGIERRRCYIRSILPIMTIDSRSVANSSIRLYGAPLKRIASSVSCVTEQSGAPLSLFGDVLPRAGSSCKRASGVAGNRAAGGYIPGHDTARAHDRVIADGHARKDDRTAPDPDVAADGDGSSPFQTRRALGSITRMIGRQNLNAGSDLRCIPYGHPDHIEDHAVEIQKHAAAQMDIISIVAVEWRSYRGRIPERTQALAQQRLSLRRQRAVEALHPVRGR